MAQTAITNWVPVIPALRLGSGYTPAGIKAKAGIQIFNQVDSVPSTELVSVWDGMTKNRKFFLKPLWSVYEKLTFLTYLYFVHHSLRGLDGEAILG